MDSLCVVVIYEIPPASLRQIHNFEFYIVIFHFDISFLILRYALNYSPIPAAGAPAHYL